MKTWLVTPTGISRMDGWMRAFRLQALTSIRFSQRPHGESRVRVFPPRKGCRLQSGRPHDAGPAKRGHGEGRGAVYRKNLTSSLFYYSILCNILTKSARQLQTNVVWSFCTSRKILFVLADVHIFL